jgi:hypothetical protein
LGVGQKDKSFLVLFFKKEQKRSSLLKKRSKKLLSFWVLHPGRHGLLLCKTRRGAAIVGASGGWQGMPAVERDTICACDAFCR